MTEEGLSAFNTFLQSRSYIEGCQFSNADKEWFHRFVLSPDGSQHPHVFRWYLHIASLLGIRFLPVSAASFSHKESEWEDLFADHSDSVDVKRESRAELMERVKREVRQSIMARRN